MTHLNQLYPMVTGLREAINREPLRDLLRQCLPIVEKHALGPSGCDPQVWELLERVRKETQ